MRSFASRKTTQRDCFTKRKQQTQPNGIELFSAPLLRRWLPENVVSSRVSLMNFFSTKKRALSEIDSDKYIFGKGNYTNMESFVPFCDGKVFRIDPAPIPYFSMAPFNLVIIACCGAFHLVAKHLSQSEPFGTDNFLVYVAPILLAIFTCVVFDLLVYFQFSKDLRLGPWFEYDLATGDVSLPRHHQILRIEEFSHLQFTTTQRVEESGPSGNYLSELNVVANVGGEFKRWPMLRSIFAYGAFAKVLRTIETQTDLTVIRVESNRNGEISETPMFQTKKRAV